MTGYNRQNVETGVYNRMTADVYDAIYSKKNYEAETATLKDFIGKYKISSGNELLDVACGTGLHLQYLTDDFAITGIDLSKEQLIGAKKRLPKLTFAQGDMRDFDLHHQFDVVTCLFSSTGYMHTKEDLDRAIKNMAAHVKPGGLLIVEPWLQPGKYDPNRPPSVETGGLPDKGIKVTRTARNSLEGNISILNMHNIIEGPNGTEEFTEVHRLALYTAETYQQLIKGAGLTSYYDERGLSDRGLHIGVKSLAS